MINLPILINHELITRPFGLFDSFFERFDSPVLFGEEKKRLPRVDVSETDKELIVKAEIPGVSKEDINVTLTDGLLTVSGEKKHEKEEKKEEYHLIERHHGSFCRTVRIPAEVEIDKIDATYKDGVLTVTVPKPETVQSKKIEIKN